MNEAVYSAWNFSNTQVVLYSGPLEIFCLLFATLAAAVFIVRRGVSRYGDGRSQVLTDILLFFKPVAVMNALLLITILSAIRGLSLHGIDSDIGRDFPIRQGTVFAVWFLILLLLMILAHCLLAIFNNALAQQSNAPNHHASGTFGTTAKQPLVPKASGGR